MTNNEADESLNPELCLNTDSRLSKINYPSIPDVRDGLTHRERVILWCLHECQKELGGRNVPSIMLYGRVSEHLDIGEDELKAYLNVEKK